MRIYISYNMSDEIESKYYISGGTIKQMQLKYSSCYKNELPANGFFFVEGDEQPTVKHVWNFATYFFWGGCQHNSLPLGPLQTSSPSAKGSTASCTRVLMRTKIYF